MFFLQSASLTIFSSSSLFRLAAIKFPRKKWCPAEQFSVWESVTKRRPKFMHKVRFVARLLFSWLPSNLRSGHKLPFLVIWNLLLWRPNYFLWPSTFCPLLINFPPKYYLTVFFFLKGFELPRGCIRNQLFSRLPLRHGYTTEFIKGIYLVLNLLSSPDDVRMSSARFNLPQFLVAF